MALPDIRTAAHMVCVKYNPLCNKDIPSDDTAFQSSAQCWEWSDLETPGTYEKISSERILSRVLQQDLEFEADSSRGAQSMINECAAAEWEFVRGRNFPSYS